MNPLIEGYVDDVARRLTELEWQGAKEKLSSDIAAMLPQDASEADVARVINSLGPAETMAERMHTKKRYLISPSMFDSYLSALRRTGAILFVIVLSASLIADIVALPAQTPVMTLVGTILVIFIKSAIFAGVAAFCLITAIFALNDYLIGRNKGKAWTVESAATAPKRQTRILRSATAVSLVLSAAFYVCLILVMLRYSHFIAWYEQGAPIVPLFSAGALKGLVPYTATLALLGIVVGLMKLYFGVWNMRLALINAIFRIASAAFALYFLHAAGVFEMAFLARVAQALSLGMQDMMNYFNKGLLVISAIVVIAAIWDIGEGFFRASRG